ncbi:MAG: hypothetical protein ABSB74_05215 [Tepidisphaeraceae bacterium]
MAIEALTFFPWQAKCVANQSVWYMIEVSEDNHRAARAVVRFWRVANCGRILADRG